MPNKQLKMSLSNVHASGHSQAVNRVLPEQVLWMELQWQDILMRLLPSICGALS